MKDPILVDENSLHEAFIPTNMPFREGHLKEILQHLKPALHKQDARNVLLTGPTGTGKTTLAKWILAEHFPRRHAYVNCLNTRSEHKILESILIQLGHVIPENKPTDYLAQKFEKKVEKGTIVCLDEVDQIKDERILATLSSQLSGLVLITNRGRFFDGLDSRISSRLFAADIEFRKYASSELMEILEERAGCALRPDSITPRILELISMWANGDARVALQTLKASAKLAEAKQRECITLDEVKEAFGSARISKREYLKSKLNEHQKVLLNIIERRKNVPSGELWQEYQGMVSEPLGERAYRNQMDDLVKVGLVKDSGDGRWKRYEVNG
ncbi:MAG: AAA family ATPase [Thaumarchaeota archaeon]|nr:AAA family ATPase [Nitrososphaerota archaeon]